jgi:AraC family transcriptional regulator, ethanolamine operon transcriptional activator
VNPSTAVQLGPGTLELDEIAIDLDPVRLRRIICNVGVSNVIHARERELVVAYLSPRCAPARLNGELWLNRRLAVIFGPADFSVPQASVLSLLKIDARRVPVLEERLIGSRPWGDDWFSMVDASDCTALRLQARIEECVAAPPRAVNPTSTSGHQLVPLIVRAAEIAARPENRKRKQPHRQAMVAAAETYMWSHIYDDICLQEICRGINCGARTLINYFHSLYGMGPIRYLKILRLNRVREALRARTRSVTIFNVAADYGFWHMGHFSTQYRALFGETPSQTLRAAT